MTNNKERGQGKAVIVPYVIMDRVVETIKSLYKEGLKEANLQKVADILGCSTSNINNVAPTLGILGLAQIVERKLVLTNDGMAFAEAVYSGNEDKSRKIIRNAVEKSDVLKFVESLLKSKAQLSGEGIGRALSERFNKDWKDVRSYRTYGNACASIISYAGIGFYDRGVLSLKPSTQTISDSTYPPEIGYNGILGLLRVLNVYERAKIPEIAKKMGHDEKKDERAVWVRLAVCSRLNLVNKEIQGVYSITELGRKLIDPTIRPEVKTELFRNCLFNSQYGDIIRSIASSATEITVESTGEALSHLLRRAWSNQTRKLYSKKFLTWLQAAGIAKKIDRARYRIEQAKTLESIREQPKSMEKAVSDSNFMFSVGRAIGSIESLLEQDKDKIFKDKLSELKVLLKDHEDLGLLLDMLQKNYEFSVESKNQAVFSTNMIFVNQKIKERLSLGSKGDLA